MARPKRPFNGVEEVARSNDLWLIKSGTAPVGVRQRQRWEASAHWAYRNVNGQYDPLTYLHILDAIANIDPDIELRAKNLADFLDIYRPTMIFDAVTVGKVLSDLCEAFEGKLGEKTGLLERGKDYKGTFYRLHHYPEVANLYYDLRDDLQSLAEVELSAQANGQRSPRLVSPLLECPSVREEWSE